MPFKAKPMRKSILLSLILLFLVHLTQAQSKNTARLESKKNLPKNIILMIGDGMGLSQMYAAYTATKDNLNMTRCTNIALVKTFSENDYITDSGAAGTAIATGHKTTNGMIGMLTDKTPVTSILKYAENSGLATGLVATSSITHATPAAFIACVESRKMMEEIAGQFLYTDIDVFIGGGYDNFGKRADSLNLIDSLIARNYRVVKSIPEMMEVNQGKLAALLYPEHAPKYSEGRGDMLSLATSKAIDLLSSNEKGFFLMVEGSQIDWGGHDNDLEYIISETIDFDKACGVAMEFAERNGETLVIITADHETGGLGIPAGDLKSGKAEGKFTTGDHSAIPVPLYSVGPGSEKFHGFIDNTDIFKIMFDLFRF
jgi:alkaline phosphatase